MLEITCQGSDLDILSIDNIMVLRVIATGLVFNLPLTKEVEEKLLSVLRKRREAAVA